MSRRRRRSGPTAPGSRGIPDILYPTLDLHGMTASDARRSALLWIKQQQAAGEPVVRVVTGRGMHSVGPAVLPEVIESLLAEQTGGSIHSYEREPGGGAYRIRLRRATPVRRVEPTVIRLPPELVRLAEERLAELGITPTRALVDAEVRQIIAERERNTP